MKKIYAIAILEALANISGRNFPVIIDTPLRHLDSQHRDKLINNYFPFSSHQVVLLSTNSEVEQRYFANQLKNEISNSYEIVFDVNTKSFSLEPSYFREPNKEII